MATTLNPSAPRQAARSGKLTGRELTVIWLFSFAGSAFIAWRHRDSLQTRGCQNRVWLVGLASAAMYLLLTAAAIALLSNELAHDVKAASHPTVQSQAPPQSTPITSAPSNSGRIISPVPQLLSDISPQARAMGLPERDAAEATSHCGAVPSSHTDLYTVMVGIERNIVAGIKGNTACGLLAMNDTGWVSQMQALDNANVRLYDVQLIKPGSGTAQDGESVTWMTDRNGSQLYAINGVLIQDDQGWHLSNYTPLPTSGGN